MIDTLVTIVRALPRPALCLDFDGTLVEIAARPEAITVDPALPELLARLARRLDGRLALITGRTHADLSRYLDLTSFFVASSHGAEFSAAGETETQALLDRAALDPIRPRLADAVAGRGDVYIEDKGTAIVLHTRPSPHHHDALLDELCKIAADVTFMTVSSGKGIVEVKLVGETKGTAVRRLMRLSTWQGSVPVMIGDDTTDEDGMEAAQGFGGFGVQVGEGPGGARFRHADYYLEQPSAVHDLLHRLAAREPEGREQ